MWKCPACETSIQHEAEPTSPRPGVIYRCPVCRLELIFDRTLKKLVLVPVLPDEEPPRV